jgi:hypothetical protein
MLRVHRTSPRVTKVTYNHERAGVIVSLSPAHFEVTLCNGNQTMTKTWDDAVFYFTTLCWRSIKGSRADVMLSKKYTPYRSKVTKRRWGND